MALGRCRHKLNHQPADTYEYIYQPEGSCIVIDDRPTLSRQVNRIGELHPWYRKLVDSGEIDKLDQLPLMTAALLEKHYYTDEPRTESGLNVYRTSGTSSGRRKTIYYSAEDEAHYFRIKSTCFREWLERDQSLSGPKPIRRALADLGTGHAAGTAIAIFEGMGLEAESLPFSLPIAQHVEKLLAYKPDLLYTMPSILEAIAAAAPDPVQFGIRKIILVGEIATPEWQRNIAARFGIKPEHLLDTIGSIEIGAIASYDHELDKYVIADGIIAEAVPAELIEDGLEPLRDNEAVLLLTSTVRSLFPAIRFVTYDVVRDFHTIETPDGRIKQCFTCLARRIGSELKHGEKISLYDIEAAVNRHLGDAELRVRLASNKLSVYIKSKSMDESMIDAIRQSIEQQIPEIGEMIEQGLLSGIEVAQASDGHQMERGAVKSKKIFKSP